jgi:hypothetical protein
MARGRRYDERYGPRILLRQTALIGSVDMAWTWRFEDAESRAVDAPSEAFSSQSDAESWLGQTWRDLVASGVTTAVLIEDDRMEYKMSLLPAGS